MKMINQFLFIFYKCSKKDKNDKYRINIIALAISMNVTFVIMGITMLCTELSLTSRAVAIVTILLSLVLRSFLSNKYYDKYLSVYDNGTKEQKAKCSNIFIIITVASTILINIAYLLS